MAHCDADGAIDAALGALRPGRSSDGAQLQPHAVEDLDKSRNEALMPNIIIVAPHSGESRSPLARRT